MDGTWGRPRTTAELRGTGERVNHVRTGRAMRTFGIAGLRLRLRLRRRQVTTVPAPSATPVRRTQRSIRHVRAAHDL
ncbi:hypothetical protein ACFYXM_22205 [Streptomyces sp. NPDC002476]|uniref:hypothetical protein n=1 Tax=Streptomyces sp. NPDC002476 TaxID=3364648 RepID=UPI0036CAE58F